MLSQFTIPMGAWVVGSFHLSLSLPGFCELIDASTGQWHYFLLCNFVLHRAERNVGFIEIYDWFPVESTEQILNRFLSSCHSPWPGVIQVEEQHIITCLLRGRRAFLNCTRNSCLKYYLSLTYLVLFDLQCLFLSTVYCCKQTLGIQESCSLFSR